MQVGLKLGSSNIKWDCVADVVTVEALARRYLPDICKEDKDEEVDGKSEELEED